MQLLLDTHTLLWSSYCPARLSQRAKDAFTDAHAELFAGIASFWEISIKLSLGKLELGENGLSRFRADLASNQIRWLSVTADHCERVAELPFHHRDPFDRMLVAQCLSEGLALVSKDSQLDAYDITRIW